MNDYRKSILKEVADLEQLRRDTPIWRVLKIMNINSKIDDLGELFKQDLKNES